MAFRFFPKRAEPVKRAVATQRVVIEGYKPPPPPPVKANDADPLRPQLLFQGLHPDTNPSENVRTATMTCPSCSTGFRYFVNSDGKKTVVRCPGCAKAYRL